jgi:acyl-coenzyme A thioesterase PaaI-like protein
VNTTLTDIPAIAAPTDARLRMVCDREHGSCYACRSVAKGGLGFTFIVQPDEAVAATWVCPPGCESYPGIVHGGILATAMDSAMVHALFARGVAARTGDLHVRYRLPVKSDSAITISARLCSAYPPLYQMEAEIFQLGELCAHARAKFMQTPPIAEHARVTRL